jgi:hypothetical protein
MSAERQLRNASTSLLEAEEEDVLALERMQTRVTRRRCNIVGVLAMIDVFVSGICVGGSERRRCIYRQQPR